ncbi:VIT domain-containing protein [Novosphingobium sp. ST904]|uniref:VIT domain-containing protein n=1 Tax=Novosphingobium sp. ST904 TaxID=1684385 RepID=UPI001046F611|nr:VIT domain-containing protein [Novosphingobium sp. ST904]TCM41444.1 vault protein inter-alpha-trypsin-like protein [Novosphingobium sp. ST904]
MGCRRIAKLVLGLLAAGTLPLGGSALAAPPPGPNTGPNPQLAAYQRGIDDGSGRHDAQGLKISRLHVDVQVQGRLADIVIEADLTDASGTADEARFLLELPTDAVVTGYALDVDGAMIDGELLDQPRARNVYEDEVRKGIDPGLAEITAANLFQARIFPISRNQPRRIRISLSAPFDPARGLVLPLDLQDGTALHVSTRISGFRAAPEVRIGGKPLSLLHKAAGSWSTDLEETKRPVAGGIVILGGDPVAGMLVSHHGKGGDFFQIGDAAPARRPGAKDGGRLRIYWDRSLSRRDDLLDRERALLRAYVEQAAPEAIDLVTFASDAPRLQTVHSADELDRAVAAVTYRGGTSFAGLEKPELPAADTCLLFSDGVATLDNQAAFEPDCPLSIIASAPDANGARLTRMAQAAGGRFLRLTQENGQDVVQTLGKPGIAILAARDDNGRKLPFRTLPAADGRWFAVGKMPETGKVHLSIAGLRKGTAERVYEAPSGPIAPLNAAGALWASQEVDRLGDDPLAHDRMVRLARSFNVAGPSMAFLVLESPDQYLNADIAPSGGFSRQWMADYRSARKTRDQETAHQRQERLAFVVEQWTAHKTWWNSRFKPRPRVKGRSAEVLGAAPPPPPPPAPPAMNIAPPPPVSVILPATQAASAGGDDAANIVVSGQRRSSPVQGAPLAVDVQSRETLAGRTIGLDLESALAERPYLAALDAAKPENRLAVLAAQEETFGTLPAFYLETSEWFRRKGDAGAARDLLFSALELAVVDDETRQIVAFRLERDGDLDRAVALFETLAAGSDFRPQPRRALALALAERGRAHGPSGKDDLERAFALLAKVVLDPAIRDFDGIETVALMEANGLIPAIEAAGGNWKLDPRLVALLDTDIRIVIEWTNDDADIDLWVIEPNGEKVFYSYQTSSSGGHITNDMTDGYGPEEYAIRKAPAGEYTVRINGFDADRINPNGNGRVMLRMIRDFGRPSMKETLVDADIAFEKGSDRDAEGGRLIGRLTVAPGGK